MAAFGVTAEREGTRCFRVPAGQRYRGRAYAIEPDASSASYFFAAAAVTGGRVRVLHLGSGSAQGDLGLLDVLEAMGCEVSRGPDAIELRGPKRLRSVEADFSRMGDVATTLAAIAPFADGPVLIRGIAQTHYEESDRPVAAATELRRMGVRVEETPDSLTIYPGTPRPAVIQTYDDHRIAMSFAITGLRTPGIAVADPGCVAKTFPDFFDVLARATGQTAGHNR
jgi:3-phosphoshikimate 1-carboxyvinyltransferase